MSKLKQTKIPLTLEDNVFQLHQKLIELNAIENEFNWKLVRENDGKTNQSKEIMWVEWTEEGKFKARHPLPEVGLSLIMSPFNQFFTWQTTPITEVLEKRENFLKFKTKNSIYELWKLS